MTINVLIVEDDASIRRLTSTVLKRQQMHVDTAPDGLDALEMIRGSTYDVILLDIRMPRMNGREFLDYLARHDPGQIPKTIVVSADSEQSLLKAGEYGVYTTVRKPYDVDHLAALVRQCASDITPPAQDSAGIPPL